MYPELTNLLPKHLIRAFRRKYFLRVATLACLLLAGLVIVHGLLLVPSYMYAHNEAARQNAQLATLNANLHTTEEVQVRTRLSKLSANIAYLNQLATTTTA
ncbi:MAG TPA: hypothetical protein VGN56_02085, partial [Candidatus Paceibacterota bacterium]|nr:hypothetical protein [Candidatus Paceibacterota bacterium]